MYKPSCWDFRHISSPQEPCNAQRISIIITEMPPWRIWGLLKSLVLQFTCMICFSFDLIQALRVYMSKSFRYYFIPNVNVLKAPITDFSQSLMNTYKYRLFQCLSSTTKWSYALIMIDPFTTVKEMPSLNWGNNLRAERLTNSCWCWQKQWAGRTDR